MRALSERLGYWIDTHRAMLSVCPIVITLFLFALVADGSGGGSAVLGAFLLGAIAPGYLKNCARLDAKTRNERQKP